MTRRATTMKSSAAHPAADRRPSSRKANPGTATSATSAAAAAGPSPAPPAGCSARAGCPARPGWPMPSASSSCSRCASAPAAAASASRPPGPCASGSSSASRRTPQFPRRAGRRLRARRDVLPRVLQGQPFQGSFTLPRKARRRGKQVHRRGLSREQICVWKRASARRGRHLLRGLGARRGLAQARRGGPPRPYRRGRGRCHGQGGRIRRRAARPEGRLAWSYDPKDRSEGTINRINTVHSLLDSFMARFKGVSTKHLGAYLDWFRWCRTFIAAGSRAAGPRSPASSRTAPARPASAACSASSLPSWTTGTGGRPSELK